MSNRKVWRTAIRRDHNMEDELEQAIICIFDQTGAVSDDLKARAHSLLLNVVQSETGWQVCVSHFEKNQRPEVKFWCLQSLHGIIRSPVFDALDVASKDRIKHCLLSMGTRETDSMPLFIRNKLAQVIVAIAAKEYPKQWPSFFQDVLGSLSESSTSIDIFSRILVSIHEDIISLEVPRSAEEAKQSMEFKDAMRDNALEQISLSWYQIVAMFKDRDPLLVALLLNAVERYVHWIDIGLVANDKFMPILFEVLNCTVSEAQVAAVAVLTEIVNKRMDAGPKLSLIQSLGLVPIAAQWSETGVPGVDGDDHDLAVSCSKLLTNLANEILEAWKKVENGVLSLQAVGVSLEDEVISEACASCNVASSMMDQLFPAIIKIFRLPDDEISAIVAPFMLSYVNRIKMVSKRHGDGLTSSVLLQIVAVLDASASCARFESSSSVYSIEPASSEEKVMAEEEEGNVSCRRQEIFALFRNAAKVAPIEAYNLVARKLQESLMNSNGPVVWQDAEIALSLFYQMGEGVTEAVKSGSESPLFSLAQAVIQIDETIASHRLVALSLLEACTRYAKVATSHTELVPMLAAKFFGPAGLGHPSSSVPPRAAYLFCRVVKTLRAQMKPIARDILHALIPHLQLIAITPLGKTVGLVAAGATSQLGTSGAGISTPDDRMFAFEAAGVLVGLHDEAHEDEQVEWLKVLTAPLIQQLQSHTSRDETDTLLLQQSLEALNRLSKGFPPKMCASRPKLTQALIDPLVPAMQAIQTFCMAKDLRAKFLAYIHRLVECLGTGLVPHLSSIIWSLQHPNIDASDFKDILVLLNQIILRYANEASVLESMVPALFPECIAKVRELLGSQWDWSGKESQPALASSPAATMSQSTNPVGSTEDLREKADLQKQYYTFINSVTQCCVVDMVISPRETTAVPDLIQGAVSHVDPSVRKLCISTLGNVVHHWLDWIKNNSVCTTATGDFDEREIKQFAYSTFGCEVLLFSLLIKPEAGGVDIRDAASISLLTEIANQVKALYTASRDSYLQVLCQETTTKLGWPMETAQQVSQQIVGLEGRQLRSYLKTVLLEYRKI